MKEVFAITEKRKVGQTARKHILFGIENDNLERATRFTDARLKINWDNFTWRLLCEDETYEFIKKNLIFSGFDPYENEIHTEVFLKLMKDMHFYKEVVMI